MTLQSASSSETTAGLSLRSSRPEVASASLSWRLGCLGLLSVVFLAPAARAQITNVTNDQSTPIPGAGHDYIKMLSETVNPSNGSVSLRIAAPTPKGRLMNIPFAFDHDTSGVHHFTANANGLAVWALDSTPYLRGGWSYRIPIVTYVFGNYEVSNGLGGESSTCSYYSGFVFQDLAGTRHALGISEAEPPQGTCMFPAAGVPNAGDDYYRASTIAWGTPTATVVSADGTVYQLGCAPSCGGSTGGNAMPAIQIEDRNGNIASGAANFSSGSYALTDTLGRSLISFGSFASTSGDSVQLSGLSNPYVVAWKTETSNFTPSIDYLNGSTCPVPTNVDQRTVVSSITLPNGQAYTFLYGTDDPANSNPYGLLSKIIYPSGGWVEYSWGINANSDAWDSTVTNSNGQSTCAFLYGTPAVTERTVSFDGTSVALQQTFSYSTTWISNSTMWTSKASTVTTSDMVSGQSSVTSYVYSSVVVPSQPNIIGGVADQVPVESTITYMDGSGNVLQTVTKTWSDQYLLKQETITPGGSTSSSKVVYSYGPGAQVTEKDEYDYGKSTPTRVTKTTYQSFANTPIYTQGPSIFDRPCKTIVYDGSNNRFAETDYLYDGGTSLCGTSGSSFTVSATTPKFTHDETYYGPSSTEPRGNATTVTRQCFPSCSNAVSNYAYDETGQAVSMTDPNGNLTQYSYKDSYTIGAPGTNTNAYLTKVTEPPVGGISFIKNFSYSFTDGQLTVAEDENLQNTKYTYGDSLDRLTLVQRADGGQTIYSYNDAPPTPTLTTKKELTTGGFGTFVTSVNTTDGIGHVTNTQLTSDPDGTDTTLTTYDGHGNVYTRTSPYRSTSDSTYGITTYTYDALGRVTKVTDPSSFGFHTVTSSYSSNCTTVTDEAGISRQSCTDGLGRLTSVTENPGGLGYVTSYQYDVLDDLTSVVQNGSRPRTFVYDSLAQLTSSTNPESNTTPVTLVSVPTTYQYDLNGNLTSKTMPAQNQQGTATVTLFYCYDAHNRIAGKAYTSQSCPMSAPVASYSYDNSACLGQSSCFNLGRRTGMTDAAGSESWAYDDMGRTLVDQRTTNGITKSTIYSYSPYVDGSINTITYPSGRVITYTTGAAERALSAADSTINYATGAHYVAAGALAGLQSGGILNSTYIYNNRLQPCWSFTTTSTALGTSTSCTASDSTPGNILDLKYTYLATFTSGNNGDVAGITNNRDTTRSQSFTYDALNRILTAETSSTYSSSPLHCFGEAYIYDSQPSGSGAFGNLTNINSASTNYAGCTQESLNVAVNGQNQVTTYGYDTAGNLTSIPAPAAATYSYNPENQMTQASTPVGVTSYAYDGDGKRAEKVVGSTVTKIYWYGSDGQVFDETDGSGSTTNVNFYEYVFFGGKRIARRDSSGNVLYYFADHLGTSRSIAEIPSEGTTATLCYDADFYPFGGERLYLTNCEQNYNFTGKERDSESNLDNFGARFYSSQIGRFMSPDWSSTPDAVPYADFGKPQSLNLYGYVKDNPLSKTDPDGHCDVDGEHHGWVWCAAHAVGITETARETQSRLLNEANGFISANNIGLIEVNGHWQTPSESSDEQLVGWWNDYNKDNLDDIMHGGRGLAFASASAVGLTTPQVRDLAKYLGFRPVNVDWDTHGQAVFEKDGRYISLDKDSHSGGVWKEFDRQGNRTGTLDVFLNKIGK